MLTYIEVIALRDKLASGEIGLKSAQTQYWKDFKDGQKSWTTKDWKDRRSKIIKDKCQICNSTDTLTIQHRSHPKKYSEYLRDITRNYTDRYINTNSHVDKSDLLNHILSHHDYIPVPYCPACKNSNPSQRVKKLPQYRCAGCKHEFDDPLYLLIDELVTIFYENENAIELIDRCFVSNDQWRNRNNLAGVKYWLLRERAKNADAEAIEKEAFFLYLNDSIKYLSFEDTITACKKCAFSYDINRMNLCPQCQQNYKGIQYPTCIQCLPEDKRKAALESIAFGKEWRDMHEQLGID